MINWVKKRVEERTSWDGGALIVLGVIVLIATVGFKTILSLEILGLL